MSLHVMTTGGHYYPVYTEHTLHMLSQPKSKPWAVSLN